MFFVNPGPIRNVQRYIGKLPLMNLLKGGRSLVGAPREARTSSAATGLGSAF